MPTWLAIVITVVLAAIVLLAIAGMAASARHHRSREGDFRTRLAEANRALAAAHAADRGWDPAVVEATARAAFSERRPGEEVREVTLVQVIDLPGTDGDKAVFRVVADGGNEATVRLGRREGAWVLESVE